jgi:hypothetical protein
MNKQEASKIVRPVHLHGAAAVLLAYNIESLGLI